MAPVAVASLGHRPLVGVGDTANPYPLPLRPRARIAPPAAPSSAPASVDEPLRHTVRVAAPRAKHAHNVRERQLGHTGATATLRWYARWLPRTDRRAEDMLDDGWVSAVDRLGEAEVGTVGSQLVGNPEAEDESGAPDDSEAPDSSGGPSGTRTPDPLIKSQGIHTPPVCVVLRWST